MAKRIVLRSLSFLICFSSPNLISAQVKADVTTKIEAPQPKPAPGRVADKKFLATMAVLAAAKTADGLVSAGLDSACRELNPVLGTHPSDGRYAGYFAATYAIEFGTAYLLKRYGQHHRWARHLWLIEPGRQVPLHIYWAAHNSGLRCR